jgi:cell fate regulator YaaT (PSP1 superfamily)
MAIGELRITDEQIEILLLTTDTDNRQLTGTGNCADRQQRFLEGLSLQRFAQVTVKSQIEESLFVPFERFSCRGEN